MRFGDKNGNDFVDHHDTDKRATVLLRMKKYETPFHPNYWRIHLLNTSENLQDCWNSYITEHNYLKM